MNRWRWVSGIGVVAALAVAVVLLTLRGGGDSPSPDPLPPTTLFVANQTTTTELSTSVAIATTVTTTVAERQAEVEALLADLWFGWFDAIYRKDADALWEVVATSRFYEDGLAAMETMDFTTAPTRAGVLLTEVSTLLDREDCLVVQQSLDLSTFRGPGATGSTVSVLWFDVEHGYRFATSWQYADDLWLDDCDLVEREPTP